MGVVWPNRFETGLSVSVNGTNDILYGEIMDHPYALVVRRREEDCRQGWRLRILKLTGSREKCKH